MAVKLTKEMITAAQNEEKKYGIPASITLGQIILESSGSYKNGMSKLAYEYNNLFGVTKGSSWSGQTIVMSNSQGKDTQTYRVYGSVSDSIADHSKILMNDRYTKYTKNAKTVEEYAKAIKKGGYARDPQYAQKLTNVIKTNNLEKYDKGGFSVSGIVETAKSAIGRIVYSFGEQNINLDTMQGIGDCSSFVQAVFQKNGYTNVGRSTEVQWTTGGMKVSKKNLQPGDVVFFKDTYSSGNVDGVSHVGIYIGDNKFVHNSTSDGVTTANLNSTYWKNHYLGAKRFANEKNETEVEGTPKNDGVNWIGQLIVLILCVLCIGLAILFFIKSFDLQIPKMKEVI